MSIFLRRWLSISFLNLLIVASLGVILRYKIAFFFPYLQQKFILDSHSHFAFTGWITQTLMVLLVQYLSLKDDQAFKRYRWLLCGNLLAAYGMLISFAIEGYAFISISFSTLSIFVSYFFALCYWRDLNKMNEMKISHWWFKASLLFSIISSIGAFGLAYMMVNKISHQNWYLSAIYFFLHFQYNGWFFFAGTGLLVSKLETIETTLRPIKIAFILFSTACFPAYFLSVLWLPIPSIIFYLIIACVIAQLAGWLIMVKVFFTTRHYISREFSKYSKLLLLLSGIAFSIKLLLQCGSVHPALSQLSYGFRPIIIGYLHLVLLAVTSIFIVGFIVNFYMIPITKVLITGIYIFVAGVILNEVLLMIQGIGALSYTSIPGINILLLIAGLILFTGIGIIFLSRFRTNAANT